MNLITAEQEQQISVASVTVDLPTNVPNVGYLFTKRLFDIVVSLLTGAILLVPMLIIALVIRIDSPGPALFRQERLGKNGNHLRY